MVARCADPSRIHELRKLRVSHLRGADRDGVRRRGCTVGQRMLVDTAPSRHEPMALIELLVPEGYRRIPWKNGRGELIVIDGEGGDGWQDMGIAWHFGRTAIIEEGPFSDYTGYERMQVVIRGAGLVLVAPDHEIDLRLPMQPRRYDGGTPIRTVLEKGSVEVVNLIARRARFDTDLRVAAKGVELSCKPGRHIVHAPGGEAKVEIEGRDYPLKQDHALRVRARSAQNVLVHNGEVIIGSILDKA